MPYVKTNNTILEVNEIEQGLFADTFGDTYSRESNKIFETFEEIVISSFDVVYLNKQLKDKVIEEYKENLKNSKFKIDDIVYKIAVEATKDLPTRYILDKTKVIKVKTDILELRDGVEINNFSFEDLEGGYYMLDNEFTYKSSSKFAYELDSGYIYAREKDLFSTQEEALKYIIIK